MGKEILKTGDYYNLTPINWFLKIHNNNKTISKSLHILFYEQNARQGGQLG